MAQRGQPAEVLIVGTGLIGTSVGLALRESQANIYVNDENDSALEIAIERGAGQILPANIEPDLVVVCVPPVSVARVATEHLAKYQNATVTDVASVKRAPIFELAERSADLARFVGGHPMAGLEVSGPAAGRADLFQDRLWAITPTSETDSDRVADVRWLARHCGAVCVELAADQHDHAVALTSHTPQVLSSVLAAQLVGADSRDVALSGQGLRDVTRLAGSNPELWAEILAGNASEVSAVLRRVCAQLDNVADALSGEEINADLLVEVLQLGNAGRSALPDKHGGAAHAYDTIHVVVADQPGELGRLFVAAGDAGVNLEDVRIEHTVGRLRATVELDVTPQNSSVLRRALLDGGWTLRS